MPLSFAARGPMVIPAVGGPPVTFDATGTVGEQHDGANTSISVSDLTVGTGHSNYALVAALNFINDPGSPTVNWDSGGTPQAMTPLGSILGQDGFYWQYIFGLLNPTAGNKILTATFNIGVSVKLAGVSFYNVTAFQHFTSNTGAGSTSSVTVSSATNHMVVASHMSEANFYTSVDPTQWYISSVTNGSAGNYVAGATSVTSNGAINSSTSWGVTAVDLVN